MAKLRVAICCAVVGLLVCSCGESEGPPTRVDAAMGDTKEGAPLVMGVPDKGILADGKTYQPPRIETGIAPGPERGGDGGTGSETADVAAMATQMAEALRTGQVDRIVAMFRAEDVAALTETEGAVDALFTTYEKVDLLSRTVQDKGDDALAGRVRAQLTGVAVDVADVQAEMLSPDRAAAGVGPAALLGGVRELQSLGMTQVDGTWKFTLESPLTAEEAEQIVAYHEKLQDGLDKLIEWVDTSEEVDADLLVERIEKVLAGEEIDVSEGEGQEEDKPMPRGTRGVRPD